MIVNGKRDHGGGIDAAIAKYGGARDNWIDLSTGINPEPYPITGTNNRDWATLPDQNAVDALLVAARTFWNIPSGAAIIAAPGLSSLITRLPGVLHGKTVSIPGPTYNEYAAAFSDADWTKATQNADVTIHVHPNNPDGRLWDAPFEPNSLTIIDESFCDTTPDLSHVNLCAEPGTLILKSFGKFWGLAGVRLGFAIGTPDLIEKLARTLGPWPVSGPALAIGTRALTDETWASETRARLEHDAQRLDNLLISRGAEIIGGTPLFRLYQVDNAAAWQSRLAASHIWSRFFPYSDTWLRLGLPAHADWSRLETSV